MLISINYIATKRSNIFIINNIPLPSHHCNIYQIIQFIGSSILNIDRISNIIQQKSLFTLVHAELATNL